MSPSRTGSPVGPRLVCRCMGVSSHRIVAAWREGSSSLEEVIQVTRAGGGCTTCHPEIVEILAELRGEPLPADQVRLNRETCGQATLQRVESSLFGSIVRQLPPDAEVDLIAVDGLSVDLHLYGCDSAQLREQIRHQLRKLVCEDLEIRFS